MEAETTFIQLCQRGDLIGAQWFYKLHPTINISAYNEDAFRRSCYNGHLEVAKWLLQIKPNIRISICVDQAFRLSCYYGHLEVVKWLLQVSKEKRQNIDISAMTEEPFINACSEGHLHVAQWLLQVSKERGKEINISANNEKAFRSACSYGHLLDGRLEVAQWLQSLKPYLYVIEYDENGKYKGYRIREKEEANWKKRKYLLWLASNECPEQNRHNLLYKLPSDVSRMVIGFV
jgi:hypothetical protein